MSTKKSYTKNMKEIKEIQNKQQFQLDIFPFILIGIFLFCGLGMVIQLMMIN